MLEKQVFVASLSVMGRSVVSSEKLFIEVLRCHTLLSILTSAACNKLS